MDLQTNPWQGAAADLKCLLPAGGKRGATRGEGTRYPGQGNHLHINGSDRKLAGFVPSFLFNSQTPFSLPRVGICFFPCSVGLGSGFGLSHIEGVLAQASQMPNSVTHGKGGGSGSGSGSGRE